MSKSRTQTRRRKVEPVTLETVRQMMRALPGVEEGMSGGRPAFRCGGKMLARFHQDGESLVLKVEFVAREVLMGNHPETFYVTDNYRCWPWMFVRLANVDSSMLRSLIEEAWRGLATKRAIAAFESSRESQET